jgi:iron complex outermembrane recepter protein
LQARFVAFANREAGVGLMRQVGASSTNGEGNKAMQILKTLGLWVIGSLAILGSAATWAAESEEAAAQTRLQNAGSTGAVEEVLVTGSYLKQNAADSPSPLSIISSAYIEDIGAMDVSDIVKTMPWASGSQVRATTFGGEGADGRNSLNLRNLGHGATLILVNGKRNVASWYNGRGEASVNVNALVPNIAIDRIEIVKDGSSALYGSDAIAGVVNFLTKKNFEGFDVQYTGSEDQKTQQAQNNEVQVMLGVQGDRGGIVVSGSYLDQGDLTIYDRFKRFGGSSASSTGQPGHFIPRNTTNPITWAANGLDPGQPVVGPSGSGNYPRNAQGTSWGQADVNCEDAAVFDGPSGTLGVVPRYLNIIPNNFDGGDLCAIDYATFFSLQAEQSLKKIWTTGHYDVTDQFEAYLEFGANDSNFRRNNSLNPNAPTLTIGVDNPGNIEDAFRRGIEPIPVGNATRMEGGTVFMDPTERPLPTFTKSNYNDLRMVVGGLWTGEFFGKPWTVDGSYVHTEHDESITQAQDTLSTHIELALAGLGGPNCNSTTGTPGDGNLSYATSGGDFSAGSCYYFNPFGNARFARDGTPQTDLTLVNPPEMYKWMAGRASSDATYKERVYDLVAAGDLFDFNGRTVGLAVGFQSRRDKGDLTVDSALNSSNLDFAYGADDWSADLDTWAVFTELSLPLLDTLDLNLAYRHENIDQIHDNTDDPKFTLLWRPFNSLSLRASYGTSFRVASMQQLFGSLTTVANQTDVVNGTAFLASITQGNNELKPETAKTYNLGFSWAPESGGFLGFLDGFQIDADYFHIKYDDIITREVTANIIAADNAQIKFAVDVEGLYPTYTDAAIAGVGNTRQMIRSADGTLLRILPDFINASSAEVDGADLSASYTFDTSFGLWRIGAQGEWMHKYEITNDGITQDAVGKYNAITNPVARPLPEFQWIGTLNWSLGQHRVFALWRYIDDYNYGSLTTTTTERFFRETVRLALGDAAARRFYTKHIHAMMTTDLRYSYDFGEVSMLSDATVSVGVANVFNEDPPYVPYVQGFDPTQHDPLGRIWQISVSASM